jgi:hypothetical protein
MKTLMEKYPGKEFNLTVCDSEWDGNFTFKPEKYDDVVKIIDIICKALDT